MKLTTLTKEFFMPGFLERDEGEREPPYEKYPWDGVSGVRPYPRLRGDDDGRCGRVDCNDTTVGRMFNRSRHDQVSFNST